MFECCWRGTRVSTFIACAAVLTLGSGLFAENQPSADRGAKSIVEMKQEIQQKATNELHALNAGTSAERSALGVVCPVSECDIDGKCCVTHNATEFNDNTQVACGVAGAGTTENAFARCFTKADEGVVGTFNIDSVTFGVAQFAVFNVTPDTYTAPIRVKVTSVNSCATAMAGATPGAVVGVVIADEIVNIGVADDDTYVIVPTLGAVNSTAAFVVEILAEVDGTPGEPDEYAFRPFSNDDGECELNFLAAGDCGITTYTSNVDIGFPGSQIIIRVTGHTGTEIAECGNGVVDGCENCELGDMNCGDNCLLAAIGACYQCGADALGDETCSEVTADECEAAKGVYDGDLSVCDVELVGLCLCSQNIPANSCNVLHANPGCLDPDCCIQVCTGNAFCCLVEWDSGCVSDAGDPANSAVCQPDSNCPVCQTTGCGGLGGDEFCQNFSDVNAATSQVNIFQVADNFTPLVSGSVETVCWNGAYLPDDLTLITDDDFTINFYNCVDGIPDVTPFATFSQSGTTLIIEGKQTTGALVADTAPIFEYTATLDTPVPVSAGTEYWVEILNKEDLGADTSDPPDGIGDHTWFWEDSTDAIGDGVSHQKSTATYERWNRNTPDRAFCLNLELGDLDATGCVVPAAKACELTLDEPADFVEPETCGEDPDANAGCSVDPQEAVTVLPALSTDPANPTVIVGESFAADGTRDVDWYSFDIPAAVDADADGLIVLCAAMGSEIPMHTVMGAWNGTCAGFASFGLEIVGFECGSSLAVGYTYAVDDVDLPEGLMVALARDGLDIFDGYPCTKANATDYEINLAWADTFEECFPGCASDEDCAEGEVCNLKTGECEAGCGTPLCPANLNQDKMGVVNAADLAQLLGAWGNPGCMGGSPCCADLNGADGVNAADLAQLLGAWGDCP